MFLFRHMLRVAIFSALAGGAGAARAQQPPEEGARFLDALNATTPVGAAATSASDAGWFSRAWDGTKRIAREGDADLYFSGLIYHMPYAYTSERRGELNEAGWGGGLGKSLTDAKDNKRILYAMAIRDSHYKPQYMAGYAWMARWTTSGNMKLGAGYTMMLIARTDYGHYAPMPVILPLVSVGTEQSALYATFVPASNVLYMFANFSFK
jgi:lipid IVA palmitoyltransferase